MIIFLYECFSLQLKNIYTSLNFKTYTYHVYATWCLMFQTIISDRSSIGKICNIKGTVRKDIGIRKLSLWQKKLNTFKRPYYSEIFLTDKSFRYATIRCTIVHIGCLSLVELQDPSRYNMYCTWIHPYCTVWTFKCRVDPAGFFGKNLALQDHSTGFDYATFGLVGMVFT